jgi:Zn-dependent peptidase ImmA (M78 family)
VSTIDEPACEVPEETQRLIENMVERMPLVRPFSMARFLAEISRLREKPIRLMRGNLSSAMPTGMLLRTHTADYIIVIRDVHRGHARHIQLHELGHIVLEDEGLVAAGHTDNPRDGSLDELIVEEFAHRMAAAIARHRISPRPRHRSRAQAHLHAGFAARADLCDTEV